jgi:hypothetical protein
VIPRVQFSHWLSTDEVSIDTEINNIDAGYLAYVSGGVAVLADATDETKPAQFLVIGTNKARVGGRYNKVKIESGVTVSAGDRLYLSAITPGTVTNVAPSGSGNIIQIVGFAIADGTGAGGTVDAIININYDYTVV